ncbi:TPR domain-containing protein [Tolypocladium paradoxum]|uniref:TPR domain-containing protein n=1 Tax=Tolypocladium paradoxum TaxID=94208 RepID=A0A2S4LA70_9HYPO|nr:TPR domain-containing protein [Tolypocladium paradoxum]
MQPSTGSCRPTARPSRQSSAAAPGLRSQIERRRRSRFDECFAGHGGTHPDPLQSRLLLDDWRDRPLTVARLLETNLSTNSPFLAHLSACGTGQNLDSSSADESLHLTSAFQLAGFRHVIGTLWEVDDQLCVDTARMTSEFLGEKGLTDASVSTALHEATRMHRDRRVGEERYAGLGDKTKRDASLCEDGESSIPPWVPHVHFGV